MQLTASEIELIRDDQILLRKRAVLEKIEKVLSKVELRLKSSPAMKNPTLPEGTLLKSGKISRGENYGGQSYLVLDHPRYSHQNELFLYRTMFWWGHYFLCYLISENCGHRIVNAPKEQAEGFYINIGESPWNYDLNDPSYWVPFDGQPRDPSGFLYLAKAISFDDIDQLPELSGTTFETLISFLS